MVNYQLGKIYKVINTVNDIVYIGSTCRPLSVRMCAHRSEAKHNQKGALYPAMRELGIGKFRIVLIEEYPCLNKMQLEARECKTMVDLKFDGVHIYNLMINGHSDQTREKLRKIGTGRIVSEETRAKLSQVNTGKILSLEHREKLSQANLGKTHTDETCSRISQANTGRIVSEETREKIRKAQFKRGSIYFDASPNRNAWKFCWNENGSKHTKSLSVNKYGERAAYGLALFHQDETFPEECDDDSEFLNDLKRQLNAN
ncbi:MAG: NUMOD3 domain-containing DNA-binding protein [Dehalococcoidales bacterium]|nr:NUMOD3 domain-containing DNA-binding protein [Dehalococcoidales bacterium]